MSEDSFDKEEFVKKIEEAIPKYEKTLERVKGFIHKYRDKPETRKKIEKQITELEKAINDLKITRQLYSPEKREPDFAPEDYNEKDFKTKSEQKISLNEIITHYSVNCFFE